MESLTGKAALVLLSDPGFGRQWDALYAGCPWATAYQSRTYAAIWYEEYASVFEPVLVWSRDAAGELSGVLALAHRPDERNLVYAGAHQTEYQVWLARPGEGDAFAEAAFDHLAQRFPGGRLSLMFLPPGSPLGFLEPPRPWAARSRFREVQRPLMAFGPAEESLGKKRYRTRINKLGQLHGPVRMQVLRSREEIAPYFDRIMDLYDFRVAGRYGHLPVRDDPFRREFTLRLVDSPEITHASVLLAGEELLAAHIGARNGGEVQLGLTAQSPFHAEHSPGTLLLLMLGRQLAAEGFERLDLTPHGQYKDRFATSFDTVHAGCVFFQEADVRRYDRKRKAAEFAKSCLARVGMTPERARERIQGVRDILRKNKPHTLAFKIGRFAVRRLWSETALIFYEMSAEEAARQEADPRFHRDSLPDLLLYEPPTREDRTKCRFLHDAMERLGSGGHSYTVTDDGRRLMHYAWLSPAGGPTGSDIGGTIDLPAGSWSLWDDFTHPDCRGMRLHQASIRTRLRDASALVKGEGRIYISVLAHNAPSRHNIEGAGFRRYATVVRRFRWGKASWQWNIEH